MITRYMETRDPAIYKKYKSVRNAVTREIRKIVRNEQHEVALQCKSNPKKFWNYINSKRTTKSAIGDLVTTDNYGNNVTVSGNEQKAEVLGSYFSGVFTITYFLLVVLTVTGITDITRFHTLASFRHRIYLLILLLCSTQNSGSTCGLVKDDW